MHGNVFKLVFVHFWVMFFTVNLATLQLQSHCYELLGANVH